MQAGVVVSLPNVTGGDEAEPVGDPGAFDGGAIAMGLSDGPGSHEAAGAPAENGQAIRVRPSLGDGKVGGAIDVVIGAITEMLINRRQKIRTVACGAAIL